jgi:hypothetical protein
MPIHVSVNEIVSVVNVIVTIHRASACTPKCASQPISSPAALDQGTRERGGERRREEERGGVRRSEEE